MKILFSTAYLPPVNYISACLQADTIYIESCENYTKQTIRNHCLIYGPNGKQLLTIPVIKVNGNHTLIKDIRIANAQPWQKWHWRSIETAYNNSPFFIYYRDYFEPFYCRKFEFLLDYNTRLLETIFLMMRLDIELRFTETYERSPVNISDLRYDHFNEIADSKAHCVPYTQVFQEKHGYFHNLSILDLICNSGPSASEYLT